MSKKPKIDKRLDSLFKGLAPEKSAAKTEQVPETKKEAPFQPPAADPAPVERTLPVPAKAKAAPQVKPAKPAPRSMPALVIPEPIPVQGNDNFISTYSIDIQSGYQDWSTLRVMDETGQRRWTPDDELLIKQVSNQLSLALENARLFEETQKRAGELATLNEFLRAISEQIELKDVLKTAYERIVKLIPLDAFFAALYDESTNTVSYPLAVDGGKFFEEPDEPLDPNTFSGKAILSGKVVFETIKPEDIDNKVIETTTFGNTSKNYGTLLFLPLRSGTKTIGCISFQSYEYFAYQQADIVLLENIANQISIGVQNARLFQETERRAREMAALAEVGREVSSTLSLESVLEKISDYAKNLLDAETSAVYLPDPQRESWRAISAVGADAEEIKTDPIRTGNGIIGKIALAKAGQIVNNASQQEGAVVITGTQKLDFEHLMGIPILAQDRVTGLMAVWRTGKGKEFKDADLNFLTNLGQQAAIAIENARLFQETQERNEQLATLNEIMGAASQTLDLRSVLSVVLEKVLQATGFNSGLITMFNVVRGKLERAVSRNMPGQPPMDPAEGLENSLCTYVFNSRQDLFISNLTLESPVDATSQIQAGLHGYIGIPLEAKGNTLGTLCIFRYADERIPEKAISLCKTVAVQLGFAIDNSRLFELSQASEANARKRNEELAVLNSLSKELTKLLTVNEISELTYRYTSQLMDTSSFFICLADHDRQELKVPLLVEDGKRIETSPRKLGNGLSDYVIRTNRPLYIPERMDERRREIGIDVLLVGTQMDAKSWMGVPMSIGDRVLGAIVVQSLHQERLHTEHHRELLLAIAQQAAVALENSRLFELSQTSEANARKSNEELALINRVITTLTGATSLQKALRDVIYQIVETFPVARGAIGILDENRQNLTILADHAKEQNSLTAMGLKISVEGNSATKTVITTLRPFILDDATNNPAISATMQDEYRRLGVEYSVIFPIVINDQAVGTLGLDILEKNVRLTRNQIASIENALSPVSTAISRLRAEEALKKSEADLRTLFSSMEDVVLVVDRDGRYKRIAETGTSRLIRPPDELLGRLMHEVVEKETADRFVEAIQKTLDSGESVQLEYNLPVEGETYWFLANLTRLNESDVFWVARDITERKKSEEAIRRRNEYLAASGEISKIITSTLDLNTIFARTVNLVNERFHFYHAGIFIVEETGFNAVLREATGEAGKAMKERKHSLQVNDKSIVGKVTQEGKPVIVNDVTADQLHRPNPLLPETRAEAAIPLRIGSRIIGALDIQSKEVDAFTEDDIAVLQTLADQVAVAIDNARSFELSQQAVMEMREIDRLKSQFLANMSHELRTPLNSIIGFSRVIIKGIDGPVTELQQQDLTAIYNSGQHLLGLINDILDLSKIEAGKMELAFDEVNIADIANSVLSTMSGLIKDKPIQMKREIQPDLPAVRADAIRIRQVMINLLSNAAKFTDEGAITMEVSLQPATAGRKEVRVSVTDTGPGIASHHLEKLFQPFSQVDDSPTRKTGGTGLGLSICQHIINMHGGRIWVESELGKGSTFLFTLPLFRQEKEGASPTTPANKVVLTIDDDIQVIGLYERYLRPQGYDVIPLTDPSQAVERVKQLRPFAVTLDIMMPGIDGWQVLDNLKGDPDTRHVPVIICSIIEDLKKGFNLGATDYLVKPILEEDLVNALDRLNTDGSIRDVLVVDDNPDDLRLIAKILSDDGRYKAILAEGGRVGWDLLSSGKPPHAVVLDLFMPEMDGFKILENMQASESLRDIPVVVISGMELSAEHKEQLNEFGQRLLSKGSFSEKELLTSLQRSLERVHK